MISQQSSIKDIAKHYGVTDRSVRNWLKDARKELGNDFLGSYEKGRLVFSPDEVETLASYGSKVSGSEPVTELIEPEFDVPEDAVALDIRPIQAAPIVNFHFHAIKIQSNPVDTTAMEIQTDQFNQVTAQNMGAVQQLLIDQAVGELHTAKTQISHGIAGMKAMALTEAIRQVKA
jgi:hypothetical protein